MNESHAPAVLYRYNLTLTFECKNRLNMDLNKSIPALRLDSNFRRLLGNVDRRPAGCRARGESVIMKSNPTERHDDWLSGQ